MVDKLVDQITTTCFNLLDELKIPSVQQAQQEVTTYKPAWLPSVQVVVKAPETTVEETETDKELIINNQGSPLILHMGHERR